MALFKFKREWYSKHFAQVLLSQHRYLILLGGRGSGKTRHIMLKLFAHTFSEKHVSIVYCRHEFETIRKNTFKDMCNFLKSIPELDSCFTYSTSPNGSMAFTNNLTGNQIVPFGLEDPDKTKGISEATTVWIDEIDKCTEEQFAMVNSVLRTPQAEFLQFIGSFNPVSEKSFLRKMFFSDHDAYAPHPRYGNKLLVHHSTVYNNEYINVEEYVETLRLMYAGNKALLDVNVNGYWGIEQNKNPWFHAFDMEKHVRKVKFLPSFHIYAFIDINNDPLEATVWQMSPNKGDSHSFIHCIDEFSGKYKAAELGAIIKTKYPYSIIFLGGDSSGQNEDVGRNQTVYQIIGGQMGIGERQYLLNNKNLTHADSYMLCNAMVANYPNFYIDENCKNLIHQCQVAEVDNKSKSPLTLRKDREGFKMDAFDSMRYMFQTIFHEFAMKKYFRLMKK